MRNKSIEIQFHSSWGNLLKMEEGKPNYVLPLRLESASVSPQENKRNLLLTIDVQAAIVKLESISGEILLNQEKVEETLKSYYDFSGTNQSTFHCS